MNAKLCAYLTCIPKYYDVPEFTNCILDVLYSLCKFLLRSKKFRVREQFKPSNIEIYLKIS